MTPWKRNQGKRWDIRILLNILWWQISDKQFDTLPKDEGQGFSLTATEIKSWMGSCSLSITESR